MSGKQKFEHEARLSAAAVADQLEAIAQGLRHGELTLEYDGATISMPNATVLEFEIEAEAKGEKAELTLEIVWRPSKEPRGEPARIMSAIGVAAEPLTADETASGAPTADDESSDADEGASDATTASADADSSETEGATSASADTPRLG